jgi:Tol biopolymer transport system component
MGLTVKKIGRVAVSVLVVAATVKVGLAFVDDRSGACRAGPDRVPAGAPPFPQSPSERHGVWRVDIDGSHETAVPGPRPDGWPPLTAIAWSPDGFRIASTAGDSYSLSVSGADGGGSRTLIPEAKPGASGLGPYASEPAWSPDGKQLAFASGSIQIINADGTGRRAVTTADPHSTTQAQQPAWSPDGKRIAYSAGFDTIEVVNVDGTGQRTVTAQHDFRLSSPAWSPDGQHLVFAADGGYYGTWLGIIAPDGSGLRRVAAHCGGTNPVWSPDGTTIAFEDFYGINISNADGSHRTRVPNTWYGHEPTWSSDGHRLLFFRY